MTESSIFGQVVVFIINVTCLTLIVNVLISNIKNSLKYIFMGMSLLMFIWVDFAYLARIESFSQFALLSIKIAWAITPLLFVLIYSFIVTYLESLKKYKVQTIIYFLGSFLFFYLLLFTETVITNISYANPPLTIIYGKYVFAFFGFITLMTIINFYFLVKHYLDPNYNKVAKKRIKYMLIGLSIFFVLNAIFNITLPFFFKVFHLYRFGDYSTVVFLAFLTYSTIQHHFFGTKVIFTTFIVSAMGNFLLVNSLLLSQSTPQRIVTGITFFIFVPLGYSLVVSVLKEIKQKEELAYLNRALEKSKQRYFNLAREQKDIIDIMGHEIRTPLTAIIQELNLHKRITLPRKKDFIEGKVSKEEMHSTLEMIFDTLEITDKASIQASFLVNDMLETARLDKKRFTLDYSEFDIVDLTKSAVQVMQKTVKEEEVKLTFHNNKINHLKINADETRIREALYALLSNSIKYGRDPNKTCSHIEVKLNKKGQHVIISLKDYGIGIDPKDIAKLGQKFVRLNPYMTGNIKRPGGTGLGLFVIKGVMEHHKGELKIESEGIGKGSTFSLVIPIFQDV